MKAGLLMALESSSVRAEQLARHVLIFGRPLTVAEIVGRINAVTIEDVRRAGKALLGTPPTLAAIGPLAELPRRDAIMARLGR